MKKNLLIFGGIIIVGMLFHIYNQSANSLGIIGGADGPTSIFIAKRASTSHTNLFLVIALILLVISFSFKKWLKK